MTGSPMVISPLSRYRLAWRLVAALFAFLLLHQLLCLGSDDEAGGLASTLSTKILRPGRYMPQSSCAHLNALKDVFVVMKTGANEAREKLPVHFATTLRCVPHYAVYSDLEETVDGHHVFDALDTMNPDIVASHPDFEYYRSLKKDGREAFSDEDVQRWSTAKNTDFGRDSPGWRLDKWKFLQIAERALEQAPNAKWFVFMETDTYILWSSLIHWLTHYWDQYPYYIGIQMQIGDVVFAYGGAGFVLSNAGLKMLVKQYRLKRAHYDEYTGGHWAGDCVLGKVAEDAGVHLQWSWPNLLADHPNDMNFDDEFGGPDKKMWCFYAASYHHLTPPDILQFHEFESTWRQMNGRTLRHKDVFRQYVLPQLASTRADWDSLAADVQDESSSADECRALCQASNECVQFTVADGVCKTSKVVKLGRKNASETSAVTSGWMMDRVHAWMEAMDASCWDEDWILK